MEIRFSEALPLEKAVRGSMTSSAPNTPNTPSTGLPEERKSPPITVMPNQKAEVADALKTSKTPKGAEEEQPLARETVKDLVKRSAELLSVFDRELKYEMKDDAGILQIQVIDSRDGRVVRKIPADEMIKLIEHVQSQIDDRVDVRA